MSLFISRQVVLRSWKTLQISSRHANHLLIRWFCRIPACGALLPWTWIPPSKAVSDAVDEAQSPLHPTRI